MRSEQELRKKIDELECELERELSNGTTYDTASSLKYRLQALSWMIGEAEI